MPKRPRLDLQALIANDVAPSVAAAAPAPQPAALPAKALTEAGRPGGTLKQRARQQSLYLEVPVYEVLREIAHAERVAMHALFLEGIDAVLKRRGSPTIAELTAKAR